MLGKLIGVYLGRPIENISYRDAVRRFGQVDRYLNQQLNVPLIVTDDDITGTFTFVRALEDHAVRPLTAEAIGKTWLNYVIEGRTIFWWGGMGTSTEHTAYLRLKSGIPAPQSGSAELNSRVVAEQIGSQIFIDAWAMVCPGDPERAADLAEKAARVSHDGEAVYAAVLLAAMEAMAFVEPDLDRLFDVGLGLIPKRCEIARMIDRLRHFRVSHDDWRDAMEQVLEADFGYDKFGGNCHVVPNHGVIALALLWGNDDFTRSLTIANTCGWDTDCNSGNVGCLIGIKNGLSGLSRPGTPDWRGPVADRLFLPTAEGSRAVSDALTESYRLVNVARSDANLPPLKPKAAARFHFSEPGSVQGFFSDTTTGNSVATIGNDGGKLAIDVPRLGDDGCVRAVTAVFIPPDTRMLPGGYAMLATPALSPGQRVTATVHSPKDTPPTTVRLVIGYYGPDDVTLFRTGPVVQIVPGASGELDWTVPDLDGRPIWSVGIEVVGPFGGGRVLLDRLHFDGTPTLTLRSHPNGKMWRQAWIDAADTTNLKAPGDFVVIHNRGRGMWLYGTADWTDYTVTADMTPHLANAAGLAARVCGLERYYALLLVRPDRIRLIRRFDGETVLDETAFPWQQNDERHTLSLSVDGNRIRATVDGKPLFDRRDPIAAGPLARGGIGLVVDEGRLHVHPVSVLPAKVNRP